MRKMHREYVVITVMLLFATSCGEEDTVDTPAPLEDTDVSNDAAEADPREICAQPPGSVYNRRNSWSSACEGLAKDTCHVIPADSGCMLCYGDDVCVWMRAADIPVVQDAGYAD